MEYYRGKYFYGEGTCITCTTNDGESYADCSVNLFEYGITLPEDEIVINADILRGDFYENDFKKKFVKEEIRGIEYGYAKSVVVELVDNWKDLCIDMDN